MNVQRRALVIIKRIIPLILCAAILTAALSSCAKKGKKIAFFMYNGNDTYITEMMNYMTAAVPEDVAYEVRDAGNSQSVQNQQIVELINGGYDLFVINAVDRLACSSIIERCAKEGLPVIFFNREPLEDALTGYDTYYVGPDAANQGAKQAEIAAGLFGDTFKGSVYDKNGDGIVQLVIIKGEQGHQDAEKRTDNCISRFKALGYPAETLAIEVADWNRRDGYDAMKRMYLQHGENIELVFSNNDDMALGAIDYLLDSGVFHEDAGTPQPFAIIGVDGTVVGLDAVKRGLLYGTVNNDFVKQSDAVLALADYILYGKDFAGFPYKITNKHFLYIDDNEGDKIIAEWRAR